MSGDLWYNFNWDVIWRHFDKLYIGLALGLGIAVLSLLIGCIIGLAAAVARTSGPRPLRLAVTAYTEFLRNIPILLLAYFCFYGLPHLGIRFLDNIGSFILALSIYASAYLAEVFRAGIGSVPRSYLEAGMAIGLTRWQRFRHITFPVTLRITLPSLSNNFISLFKDTSLASAIAVPELTWGAMWINVNTFRVLESWTIAGLLYLGACYVIAVTLRRIERRYAVIRRAMTAQADTWTTIWTALPSLLRGLLVMIEISALAILVGTLLGLVCGVVLAYAPAWARAPVRGYVDIIRGIPVLVLIFACFYGLPFAGLQVDAFEAGAIALAAFATAHITEVVRGGIESIPHGQSDAARAIGLRFRERLRFVILPQAMRRMLPPWVNAAVEMVKGSSLVSLIGVVDLLLAMQQVVGRTFIVIPFYAIAALFYFAINFSMSQTAAVLERRFAYLRY